MFVYLMTNRVNGKYYVGKTVSNNLNRYLSFRKWAVKHNVVNGMPLIAAMIKYGMDSFETQVLFQGNVSEEELDNLEKLWIISLDSTNPKYGYNVSIGGSGMSKPMSDETKKKIGLANKGRKPTGYIRTDLHRKQLSDRMQGNNIGVKITSELRSKWESEGKYNGMRGLSASR